LKKCDDPLDPGVLTLYRGTRAPVGGKGSLFDIKTPAAVRTVAQPLIRGVLHFGVSFWTPRSTSWDTGYGASGADAPSLTWDSTRGILRGGRNAISNEFAFARGEESLNDPRDDISPRSLQVTFVFQRTGRENKDAMLMLNVDDSSKKVTVDNSAFATSASLNYIKLDSEWMAFSGRGDEIFSIAARGARGTVAASHDRGATVRAGATVIRTIMIPSYREDWNFR
jgi:hypothetical protein